MPLPKFVLRTKKPLAASAAIGGASRRRAVSRGGSAELSLNIQKQSQTQWCWAAVCASVASFFTPRTSWTQCKIANHEMNQTTCCTDGGSASCNKPYYLDRALTTTSNLRDFTEGPLTFAETSAEIDAKSPLGCRIGWDEISGHFVLITGYSDISGTPMVHVEDPGPLTQSGSYAYDKFLNAYQGSGTWTHSYRTQQPSSGGGAAVKKRTGRSTAKSRTN